MKCLSGLEVPVTERGDVPCRHGCVRAMARFATSEGCAVFPDDREQDLCLQHVYTWGFVGGVLPVLIYIPELFADVADRF